jgi:hypothetical protein
LGSRSTTHSRAPAARGHQTQRALHPVDRPPDAGHRARPAAEALGQIAGYLDRAGLGEGWLVMFDLRKDTPWVDKLFLREVVHGARTVRLVGC